MRLTRRQLRLIIENAMSGNLAELDAAAQPVMDLLVGYYATGSKLADWKTEFSRAPDKWSTPVPGSGREFTITKNFLPKLESALRKAVSGVDETSLLAKVSELHSKYLRDGRFNPAGVHAFGNSAVRALGENEDGLSYFLKSLIEIHYGQMYSSDSGITALAKKYKETYRSQGRTFTRFKEPVEQNMRAYENELIGIASRDFPLIYKLYNMSK